MRPYRARTAVSVWSCASSGFKDLSRLGFGSHISVEPSVRPSAFENDDGCKSEDVRGRMQHAGPLAGPTLAIQVFAAFMCMCDEIDVI